MALNIFPRQPRREAPAEPEAAPVFETQPEPAPAETDAKPARRSTRSRRAPRAKAEAVAEAPDSAAPEVPAPAASPDAEGADEPAAAPRRRSRGRGRKADDSATPAVAALDQPAETEAAPRARPSARTAAAAPAAFDPTPLVRAIEQQGKQIEALTRAIQDGLRGGPSTPLAKVGVFVDVANVELGADRARVRFDWGKILRMLTRDRVLARAVAYAPVHDDPQVSRETQRFVEPFLDHGYKIVTKPLKRFADGSVKANVDIELALDIMNMLDKLDVVCLVSGDGDFEPLVRAAQERGVRVEVIALSNSCASSLRNAADSFTDLLGRLSEVRA